jgi:hypothetical protein
MAQTNGIPFRANYTITLDKTQVLEKDKIGNVTKAINIAPGIGTHSILGEVTTMSLVHYDTSTGDNVIEFSETDADGNSIFLKTKGVPTDTGWKCYGAILGGTGKYKTATGYYNVTGTTTGNTSTCTAEGMLYYISVEDDTEAIKNVIAAETQSYIDKDFDAMDNTYVIAPFTTNINNVPEGTVNILRRYQKNIPQTITKEEIGNMVVISDVVRSDWNIQLRDDVAWAVFNQKVTAQGARTPSIETRILEKVNGEWKISYTSTVVDYKEAVALRTSTK